MTAPRYLVTWVPEDDTSYVRPIGDLMDHPESDDCPCGPTTEPCPRPDGSVGWLVTHHSLDGREATETKPCTQYSDPGGISITGKPCKTCGRRPHDHRPTPTKEH